MRSGNEIGDNGGHVITLDRPLVFGETVIITRELAGCISSEHYEYTVD